MAFARGNKGVRPLKLEEITHSWGDGARRGDVRQEVQAHLAVQRPWVLTMTEQVFVILKGGRSKKMGTKARIPATLRATGSLQAREQCTSFAVPGGSRCGCWPCHGQPAGA